ncbi:hypothetical protein GGR53DRAFT_183115 [Hypoxylon sp. FL1150]|nr:hypothetical protein GGR53DRAFT_183115 [Hypoxylon sp. FL1150]
MSLTFMNRLQHDWRNARHCAICGVCNANRRRATRESHANAHNAGKLSALDAGASTKAAPIHQRLIKIPRSNRSVLLQLPHMQHPVRPSQALPPVSRKRHYVPVTPLKRSYATLQEHIDAVVGIPVDTDWYKPLPPVSRHCPHAYTSTLSLGRINRTLMFLKRRDFGDS